MYLVLTFYPKLSHEISKHTHRLLIDTLHDVEQRRNACNDYMSCTPFIALVLLVQFRFREDARRFFQVLLVQPRALLQRCTSDFTTRKEERKEKNS